MNNIGLGIDPISLFEKDCIEETQKQSEDIMLKELSRKWLNHSWQNKYTYHFNWLGRPIIQMPQDILALQEIIWKVKPDLIIETGIAHGGSLCLSASLLALLEIDDLKKRPKSKLNRKVIGIDIDIRKHNKEKIEKHFLADKIKMIEASSVDTETFKKVEKLSKNYSNVLVILDSNHTEEHVLQELNLYGSLVSKNSYCIVFDTIISEMSPGFSNNRPWDRGNSPKTAINKFLKKDDNFIVDNSIDNILLISMAPGGFLKKIK